MKRLVALNKPFKYIVTCVIMQRNGAGVHTARSTAYACHCSCGRFRFCEDAAQLWLDLCSSFFWDSTSDGHCVWKQDYKTMYCITAGAAMRTPVAFRSPPTHNWPQIRPYRQNPCIPIQCFPPEPSLLCLQCTVYRYRTCVISARIHARGHCRTTARWMACGPGGMHACTTHAD